MGRTSHSLKAEFSESNTVRPRQPGFACDEPNQGSSSTVNCVLGFGVYRHIESDSRVLSLNSPVSLARISSDASSLVRVVPATGACGGRVYSQVAAVGVANPSRCAMIAGLFAISN